MKRCIVKLILALLLGTSLMAGDKIYIMICDVLPDDIVYKLVEPVKQIYDIEVCVVKNVIDLEFAYNPKRKQYHATKILEKVKQYIPQDCLRLLVIVDKDLYTEGLNFIFGQAMGNVCIVSMNRFKPCIWRNKRDEIELVFQRVLKTSIHELGHTFGLMHCNNNRCVMFFSNWIGDTDRKSHKFCNACNKKLKFVKSK